MAAMSLAAVRIGEVAAYLSGESATLARAVLRAREKSAEGC